MGRLLGPDQENSTHLASLSSIINHGDADYHYHGHHRDQKKGELYYDQVLVINRTVMMIMMMLMTIIMITITNIRSGSSQ